MGIPTNFEDANHKFTGDGKGIGDLPVLATNGFIVSCWEFTDAEVTEIIETGKVWLTIKGDMVLPIDIAGHRPFRRIGEG